MGTDHGGGSEPAGRARESSGGYLAAGAWLRPRDELARRAADMGERVQPVDVAHPHGVTRTYPDADWATDTDPDSFSNSFSNPCAVDVALTALDAQSDRDFDLLPNASIGGTAIVPADDGVRGVPDHRVPGDARNLHWPVPDMEVDGR